MNELALFAGAGGGILGGKLLGWRTICAVEWDAYARDVLVARQNDGCLEAFPVWDDIQTFDGRPWRGLVDVVSGGFPCQDISAAGKGAGIEGERSGMWKHMARIIGEILPAKVWVENSPMLVGRGLAVVLADLAEMGYDAEWGIVGAHHAGAPHKRDRIWVLATDSTLDAGEQRRSKREGLQRATGLANGSDTLADSNVCRCDDGSDSQREHDLHHAQIRTVAEGQQSGSVWEHRTSSDCGDVADTAGAQDHAERGDCECGRNGMGRNQETSQQDHRAPDHDGTCGRGGDVADTESLHDGCRDTGTAERQEPESGESGSGKAMADAGSERGQLSVRRELAAVEQLGSDSEARSSGGIAGEWWATEPDVGRVAHGVAARVDRLRCIGNGQVPGVVPLAWEILSQASNPNNSEENDNEN